MRVLILVAFLVACCGAQRRSKQRSCFFSEKSAPFTAAPVAVDEKDDPTLAELHFLQGCWSFDATDWFFNLCWSREGSSWVGELTSTGTNGPRGTVMLRIVADQGTFKLSSEGTPGHWFGGQELDALPEKGLGKHHVIFGSGDTSVGLHGTSTGHMLLFRPRTQSFIYELSKTEM